MRQEHRVFYSDRGMDGMTLGVPNGQGTGMVEGTRKWRSWVPKALCLGSVSQSIAKFAGGK